MITIDRDKFRASLRKMGPDQLHQMLDDAIGLLPPAKLAKLAKNYFNVESLRPSSTPEFVGLLPEVKAFAIASLANEYYESFRVNSKNYREQSGGTSAWMAKCRRLLDSCVAAAAKEKSAETCEAFETIFALLRQINRDPDNIIFFADEGGVWQIGVDWRKVLPAWFSCLGATVGPEEYARRVVDEVDEFEEHNRDHYLTQAARRGSAAQRGALAMRTTWKKTRSKR